MIINLPKSRAVLSVPLIGVSKYPSLAVHTTHNMNTKFHTFAMHESANGLSLYPPADDGKRSGAGCKRPYSSSVTASGYFIDPSSFKRMFG
ncbi:hypothetical protein C2869_00020 [Saccharobesus litoralis]|uniref:Uncharacterized protein n=1 Tax=Saccharobesus litoralis TaxID=2172099 RepID=A0A2S0VL36_9ALTE|nr:hypothetical protein [Saccharobesus litoralis]AWB64923.1 hypothetical protein C2869_00020 [Saccharobesus litoralis]